MPAAVCEPKISIIPTTVPNRPSSGAIAAMVPSVVRKRSRSCVTTRPDLLDRLLHHRPRALHVGEPRGEDAAERPLLRRLRRASSGVSARLPVFGEHAIDQARRRDGALPQRPQPLEDQRQRDDRRDDQRPDRPARCLNDGPHGVVAPSKEAARNVAWPPRFGKATVRAVYARHQRATRAVRSVAQRCSDSVAAIAAPISTMIQHNVDPDEEQRQRGERAVDDL